jgi:YggT family protein
MEGLFNILALALNLYSWAIIIYILMSWFPGARESSFGEALGKITEPYLEIFRRFIPPLGMIDFSPIVAILVLSLARIGLYELFVILF